MNLKNSIFDKLHLCIFFILFSACSSPGQSTDANDLITIIRSEQVREVSESYAQGACCCFTWNDLSFFKQRDIPQVVANRLSESKKFLEVVNAIRNLSNAEWTALRSQALATRRPSWAEQGRISASGQTDAGVEAEALIAKAIVSLVEEMQR